MQEEDSILSSAENAVIATFWNKTADRSSPKLNEQSFVTNERPSISFSFAVDSKDPMDIQEELEIGKS